MKISTLLFLGSAIITGAYLSTKEGDETRKRLQNVGDNLKPIIKDLIKRLEIIMQKSKELNSDEIRVNLEQKAQEVKKSLETINADNFSDKAKEAIKGASNSIRKMWTNVNNASESNSKNSVNKNDNESIIKKNVTKKSVLVQDIPDLTKKSKKKRTFKKNVSAKNKSESVEDK